MAFEEMLTFTRTSAVANADLSAKQYFCASFVSGSPAKIDLSTAAKNIDGILQDNPASGKTGTIATSGFTKACISASQTLTGGVTLLEVDTGGTLKVLASGTAVAKAMESLTSVAAVRIVTVELLKSAAAFT